MSLTKATFSMIEGAYTNVLDYGAVGNGTADDTSAVQAAFDAGGVLYFPPNYTFNCGQLNINNDLQIIGYGATLLHRANTAATGVGLLKMLGDNKLVVRGLTIDGNATNQTATYATYNMVWCSIGSMELYDCWIGNSKGHAIRTGNIDDFDAAYFAHDVIISNCKVVQSDVSNQSGDCIRIERTRGDSNLITDNYVYGGLSGIRSQLYCKNLKFYANEVRNSWADVGITAAMSENIAVIGNVCAGHTLHGIEVDACVTATVSGNTCSANTRSGFFVTELGAASYANEPRFAGSIADGHGVDYSAQTHSSPVVPNIDAVFSGNVSENNGEADAFIGTDGDIYTNNTVNNPSTGASYLCQLYVNGGTINSSKIIATNNTFVCGASDEYAVKFANYQFDAILNRNSLVNNPSLGFSNYAVEGLRDLNAANEFLQNPSLRSVLLTDANDATSPTGWAVTLTTSGATTLEFKEIWGGGAGTKIVKWIARTDTGTLSVNLAVNLYNSSGVYVATIAPTTAVTLTDQYQEFTQLVSTSASVGCELRPQIAIGSAGKTVFISSLNVFSTVD